jgi:site-specific recombinase XerC
MPRKGRRIRIATGVYRDGTGLSACVQVGTSDRAKREEKRYPLDSDLTEVQRWQRRTRQRLMARSTPAPPRGSFSSDIDRYLATIADAHTKQYATIHLDAWREQLGTKPRHAITSVDLKTVLATWQREKSGPSQKIQSASSLNHRLTALRKLYRVLDADDEGAPNPTLRVAKLREPHPAPREIPREFIDAIFAAIPDRGSAARGKTRPKVNLTKLRLLVMSTTGLPPKQIAALLPAHLTILTSVRGKTPARLWVTPRRKGQGTTGKWIPLTPEGLQAVQALFQHGAIGSFSTSAARHVWLRAIRAAKRVYAKDKRDLPILPTPLRPYDLRHSFLTDVYRQSKDRKATQGLGLHADPRTTDRYIVGAVLDGEEAALRKVAAARARDVKHGTTRNAK